ncbi:hypothetical protein HMPREF9087_1916 [Enterococcus casseliflavus ATCC 12755]|uniref:Uncharacterized protein n=1 Tax=Enterococcus casseliflavus ATCC 12755 TaxID=888066 RepID=F0EKL0_ENTCA|nr:hypothetical protein HMPREF9087_1916 [Enterococcus casseliflavus ATCC 12755]
MSVSFLPSFVQKKKAKTTTPLDFHDLHLFWRIEIKSVNRPVSQ